MTLPTSDNAENSAQRASLKGPAYWRSLDELADTDAFRAFLHREFPEGASEWHDAAGRRRFLKLMGASLALAGLHSGCISSPPETEKIVPYVDEPPIFTPGKPVYFATAFPWGGYAQGILAESHAGRPTKIEGNPNHPASLGATNVFMQASVLDLYDPDRSTVPLHQGAVSSWTTFLEYLNERRAAWRRQAGEGLRLLTGTVTSPTLAAQIEELRRTFPQTRWHTYDPVGAHHGREGLRMALGGYRHPVYHFEAADVVVSLDSDFLFALPGSVRYARAFADRRRVREGATEMNRLYVIESGTTITGAAADHRLPLRPSRIMRAAEALARALGIAVSPAAAGPSENASYLDAAWLAGLAGDLERHAGRSLILAGETMPPAVHALVHRMNEHLGNVGTTLAYRAPVEANPVDQHASLKALVRDMQDGHVDTLVMLGTNPVYASPADVPFVEAMAGVPHTIHLSRYVDETSAHARWHLPQTHYLEAWSDARAYDGTATLMQPLIAPLYAPCRSDHEVVAALAGDLQTGYDLVRAHWRRQHGDDTRFETFWRQALFDGVVLFDDPALSDDLVPGTGRAEREEPSTASRTVRIGGIPFAPTKAPRSAGTATDNAEAAFDTTSATPDTTRVSPGIPEDMPEPEPDDLEIVFRPDPTVWDGSFANNGWLQELPKPVTKLVWDNAALVSPQTAARLGLENEQVVELHYEGRMVPAPVWIVPGHAAGTVTVHLGYGRERVGRVGEGTGFNAYRLRTADQPWTGRGLTLRKREAQYPLATTQHHHSMEGRRIIEEAPITRFRENPGFVNEDTLIVLPSLYPEYAYPEYKWGMVIDLNACIGCNACITACQAENNIPVVGKDEVGRGREMFWLRVDRYYKGDLDHPETYFQPLPCMHCEKAPCEAVCPVYATVHDAEGLNVMVYNRCIGTRYCSNNCPYKVRRFNFLQYSDWDTEVAKLQHNPDVTVRSRGVMEKCTYCTQRISAARIHAQEEHRKIRDGEVMTACQQACPTQAIVFGDLNDAQSEVHRQQAQPHNYKLLYELNTQPRTSYLAHFNNPNPDVPGEAAQQNES